MDPGIPVNGVRLSHDLSIGSVVSFQCDAGYRLSHDELLICEKNHFWSHSLPSCDGTYMQYYMYYSQYEHRGPDKHFPTEKMAETIWLDRALLSQMTL